VVCAESSLCGCVQILCLGCVGKSLIYSRHKDFREWGGDSDATVILWVGGIAFAFV
jgi:hypothetical protein